MIRDRLPDIDRAKGLAVVLVVVGHVISDELPPGNEWCVPVHNTIYKFHMAFFMFVTGYLAFYSYPVIRTLRDYGVYVKKKSIRLMPAYLLMAIVIYMGKAALGGFGHIGNPAAGLDDLMNVFLRPYDSYARSLWYIYVVFAYFLLIPPLLIVFRDCLGIVLCLAFAAYFLPRSHYFCQKQAVEYLFVFLLGGYALRHRDTYVSILDRYAPSLMTLFVGIIALCFFMDIPKLLVGLVAIPALHAAVRLRWSEKIRILPLFGQYVFPIYLFNSVLLGVALSLLERCCSLGGTTFLLFVPVLSLMGLLVPIAIYKVLIQRTPILSALIRA